MTVVMTADDSAVAPNLLDVHLIIRDGPFAQRACATALADPGYWDRRPAALKASIRGTEPRQHSRRYPLVRELAKALRCIDL